jgi:hypothetical protein
VGFADALALGWAFDCVFDWAFDWELALGSELAEAAGSGVAALVAAGALITKPDSAACPIDHDVANTPRLITPTIFLVAFLTRRTPLSECCLSVFQLCEWISAHFQSKPVGHKHKHRLR